MPKNNKYPNFGKFNNSNAFNDTYNNSNVSNNNANSGVAKKKINKNKPANQTTNNQFGRTNSFGNNITNSHHNVNHHGMERLNRSVSVNLFFQFNQACIILDFLKYPNI